MVLSHNCFLRHIGARFTILYHKAVFLQRFFVNIYKKDTTKRSTPTKVRVLSAAMGSCELGYWDQNGFFLRYRK
jgi:hypothetical protein